MRSLFSRRLLVLAVFAFLTVVGWAAVQLVPTTRRDFQVPGSHTSDLNPDNYFTGSYCSTCHGDFDTANSPYDTWSGSLMAVGGRDPLFLAQMTLAEQDAPGSSYYCMRCHMPGSIATGRAELGTAAPYGEFDLEGVSCHLCHTMVDPLQAPGNAAPGDDEILAGLDQVPEHYGNAMFVLDPQAQRRGPRPDAQPRHPLLHSQFFKKGDFCGTCHDVGNVATTRQSDGTWRYNSLDEPAPDSNPQAQFPLERTYTEWKLSAFANGGVDMGGRFGGEGVSVVSTCQDCHMPKASAHAAIGAPLRPDVARHEFAGATAWVLQITALAYQNDPSVNQAALLRGQQAAGDMLARAASLRVWRDEDSVSVRVINQTGHKLPSGHIEGRRAWVETIFKDSDGATVAHYGAYDTAEAELDTNGTTVFEMHIGLSEDAAAITGLPAGVTSHMALADTIEKDNRIPPRGFSNAAFEAGGAPAVGTTFADGQYWHDTPFQIPANAATVTVNLWYQTVTREYIEGLRDNNVTDNRGQELYDLWVATDKCAPILMASKTANLANLTYSVTGWIAQ
ncbi:hypothetical protein IT570_00735 [Candidatus Sumerlaeota bacterium]|nr:hypothetical protein [Candidatus Sumerlaeota bacterium]